MIWQIISALTPLAFVLAGYWLGMKVSKEENKDD